MDNPILYLFEALDRSELSDKEQYRNEIRGLVRDLGEYFNTVVDQQIYYYTTPKDERNDYIMKQDDIRRRECHDRCVYSCERLNEICSVLGVDRICDLYTGDRRKVAEFCGYLYISLYCSNIMCREQMAKWIKEYPGIA